MITGAHFLFYSSDPEADRAFFRDVLGFRHVDDGDGWLIFALPPSEIALHPLNSGSPSPVQGGQAMMGGMLAFMCDDVQSVMNSLKAKNVGCTEVQKQPFGYFTTVQLPSGGRMGLYQPTHQTPLGIGSMENFGALGFKTPAR